MNIGNLIHSKEFEYFNETLNKIIARLEDELMVVDSKLNEPKYTLHDVNRELRAILIRLRGRTEEVVREIATAMDKQEVGESIVEYIKEMNDHSKHRKELGSTSKSKTKRASKKKV